MRNRVQQMDAADRLEANLAAYLRSVLKSCRLSKHQVLTSNSLEERTAPLVVQIDARWGLASDEMGFAWISGLRVMISGQIDDVKGGDHKDIVATIQNAMFCTPRRVNWTYYATEAAMQAINGRAGLPDKRPQARVHLWDFLDPSSNLEAEGDVASTWIVCRAKFSGEDRFV